MKTPEKIIDATITCIERYGLDALTIRMIAESAGVNIAAVNYHFNSKENLIERVKEISFNHMLQDIKVISEQTERTPREFIREICDYLLEGSVKFPKTTQMHFHEAFVHNNVDTPAVKAFNELLRKIVDRIYKENGIDRHTLNQSLHQILATIFFVCIFPDYFQGFTDYNLKSDRSERSRFLDNLINTLPF